MKKSISTFNQIFKIDYENGIFGLGPEYTDKCDGGKRFS